MGLLHARVYIVEILVTTRTERIKNKSGPAFVVVYTYIHTHTHRVRTRCAVETLIIIIIIIEKSGEQSNASAHESFTVCVPIYFIIYLRYVRDRSGL